MTIIPRIAGAMRHVLATVGDTIARGTGFVKRKRKLSGAKFVQTLVFTWLAKPNASLEELTQTAASLGVRITPQALEQRFTPQAIAQTGAGVRGGSTDFRKARCC